MTLSLVNHAAPVCTNAGHAFFGVNVGGFHIGVTTATPEILGKLPVDVFVLDHTASGPDAARAQFTDTYPVAGRQYDFQQCKGNGKMDPIGEPTIDAGLSALALFHGGFRSGGKTDTSSSVSISMLHVMGGAASEGHKNLLFTRLPGGSVSGYSLNQLQDSANEIVNAIEIARESLAEYQIFEDGVAGMSILIRASVRSVFDHFVDVFQSAIQASKMEFFEGHPL